MKTNYGAIPASKCPRCEILLDDATAAYEENSVPKPGDVSVCVYCGVLSYFGEDLTLQEFTRDELNQLRAEAPNVYKQIKTAQLSVLLCNISLVTESQG